MRTASLLATLMLAVVARPAGATLDAPAPYKRCAACHLPTGAGVPGAFPPLTGHIVPLAATPEGRAYLVMVPIGGVGGEMSVDGKTYRGYMPAQSGMTDADVAAALNYVLTTFNTVAKRPALFTEAEVATIRAAHPGVRGQGVLALRPAAAKGGDAASAPAAKK